MNSNFWRNKKILITGGHGFVGKNLLSRLQKSGALIFAPSSKELDLREKENCKIAVRDKDIVIHLAAKVGGIGFNITHPAEMFYDNIVMGIHLMEEARLAGVHKFVALGTICAYPKYTPVPFKETDLWNGYPEETNAPYGLAKKMALVQAQTYKEQYNFNAIYLLPVNLYGPGDKFDPSISHVIPALIKKTIEAKNEGRKVIEVWGTGKATREFLYIDDAVNGIILATEKYNKSDPINLGAGFEISIKELVRLICDIVGYKGKIIWDRSMPDGQPRRKLDTSKAFKEFGFKAKTNFRKGLKETIDWYTKNQKI